ncbi:MAG: L,D-transpeptidase [Chitinophagaceae bacterium]|nr:L,D-transpeptidase [Anaerolineae bacterium]
MNARWMKFSTLLTLLGAALMFMIPVGAQGPASVPTEYDPSVCENDITGDPLSAECAAMIEAFPEPLVETIEQDRTTLGSYSFWRVGPAATPTYSTPGGAVSGEIPAGFNFVTAIDLSVDGWLQISGGQWISQETAAYREASYFTGVTFTNGLEHPFAFVLDLSMIYASEYPGGPASTATGRFLRRYETVNIFSVAVDDEGWEWYMIGPNQWVKQTFVAKVKPKERPEEVIGRWTAVDLYEQTLVAYEDDTPVFATIVATGIPPYDTNEGLFSVWARLPADAMAGATGAPEAYALQTVPWVMYFDGGISLHGTYWHDLFGYRQSHGCVNLTVSDARWIYEWFLGAEPNEDDEIVNQVLVYSSGEYGTGVIRENNG